VLLRLVSSRRGVLRVGKRDWTGRWGVSGHRSGPSSAAAHLNCSLGGQEGRREVLGDKRRGSGKAAGILLAVAASVFLSAWGTGVASAANTQGTVEICKEGAGGVKFTFTVVKGLQTP